MKKAFYYFYLVIVPALLFISLIVFFSYKNQIEQCSCADFDSFQADFISLNQVVIINEQGVKVPLIKSVEDAVSFYGNEPDEFNKISHTIGLKNHEFNLHYFDPLQQYFQYLISDSIVLPFSIHFNNSYQNIQLQLIDKGITLSKSTRISDLKSIFEDSYQCLYCQLTEFGFYRTRDIIRLKLKSEFAQHHEIELILTFDFRELSKINFRYFDAPQI